jgi:hypothetical protein
MIDATSQAILALERAGWEALSGSGGADFYDRLMAKAAVMVFTSGVMQRDEALETIRGATPWQSYRLDDEQVARPSEDIAVVTYHATAKRPNAPEYRAWMASVYVRDAEQWLLAVHQQSPVR